MNLRLSVAALLLVPGTALAQGWIGFEGSQGGVDVTIPDGVLTPGPAEVEVAGRAGYPRGLGAGMGMLRHRIRFQAVAGPQQLHFHSGWVGGGVSIKAKDEKGHTWEGDAYTNTYDERHPWARKFMGSADDFATLSRSVRKVAKHDADSMLQGFEVVKPESIDCRKLGSFGLVVIAEGQAANGEGLRRCAALGARLLVIGPATFVPSGLPAEGARLWGAGRYAWAPDLDHGAAVLRDLEAMDGWNQRDLLGTIQRSSGATDADEGSPVVFTLLALYVLALAAVGLWGVRQPRRAVRLWIAFPATAGLASGALMVASAMTDHVPTHLDVEVLDLVNDKGVGLEKTSLDVHSRWGGSYEFSLPWSDGDITAFSRDYTYGNPFRVSTSAPLASEDRLAERLTIEDVDLSRRADARFSLVQPVSAPAPYLARSGGGLEIVNPTGSALKQAVVLAKGRRSTVVNIPPGARRPIHAGDTKAGDPSADWLARIDAWDCDRRLGSDNYLLAAEADVPSPVTSRATMPASARRITMTVAPLPETPP